MKFILFISTLLIQIFFFMKLNAIGYVDSIQGSALIEISDEKIPLEELDSINIKNKIYLLSDAEISILLDDGSTIFIRGDSELVFHEYEDILSVNPHYKIEIIKGNLIVETGDIPKIKKNSTSIITPVGILYLNGTAISAKLDSDNSEIFLMTDSFGESGELILQNENGETINVEINSGVNITNEGTQSIEASEEIINNQNIMKSVIAKSANNDENRIQEIINKKIADGKITPQEGDKFKKEIVQKKEKKIDQIITASKSDTSVLGEILKNSNDEGGSKILEKVIEKNPKVTSQVLDTVIDQNENLFNQISSNNPTLTEKILKTVVKEADENDMALSKIIAKTDNKLSAKLITEIAETKKELMVKVVSETGSLNPSKFKELSDIDENLTNTISTVIVEQISESADAGENLKKIMLNADPDLTSSILEESETLGEDIISNATTEIFNENIDVITEKLSESIDSNNDTFKAILISKAIETGNTEIVTQAVNRNIEKKIENNQTNLNNNLQNDENSNSDEISIDNQSKEREILIEESKKNISKINNIITQEVEKIKLENPSIEIEKELFISVDETLASPN